ncbi:MULTISPECIES: DUF6192 family protein [unclassified Streptomyces]|uniref:DUF6192 family protein n=1 Tax=Streptomyces TaxID=1883 RepID=UPI001928DB89|nr:MULTISPECIES: DUF6192 family protein [unclassified Streptomyces]
MVDAVGAGPGRARRRRREGRSRARPGREGGQGPFEPTARRINYAPEFLDLVGACERFVAATGRIVPSLRERCFPDDERDTVHRNVDRVRATCEWILTVVDTGQVDVGEKLAQLPRGE